MLSHTARARPVLRCSPFCRESEDNGHKKGEKYGYKYGYESGGFHVSLVRVVYTF